MPGPHTLYGSEYDYGTCFEAYDAKIYENMWRMILADDDEDDIVFLKNALEQTNEVIVEALCCNSEELMGALSWVPLPDLIVCDIHMPGKSGIDICRKLSTDTRLMDIPVVLVSGVCPSGFILNAISNYNVRAVVTKPDTCDGYRRLAKRLISICDGSGNVIAPVG